MSGVTFPTDRIGLLPGQSQLFVSSGNFLIEPALGIFQLELVLFGFLLVFRRLLFEAPSLVFKLSVLLLSIFVASDGRVECPADLNHFLPMLLDLLGMRRLLGDQLV